MNDDTKPLILYLSDPDRPLESLDAECAKELLLKSWPGAETHPTTTADDAFGLLPKGENRRQVWYLSLGAERVGGHSQAHQIFDVTSRGCAAAHVWWRLHMPNCPPWWLDTLNAVVCGIEPLGLPRKRWWAWMQLHSPSEWMIGRNGHAVMEIGALLLKARERWVKDMQRGHFPATVWGTDEGLAAMVEELKRGADRLRAERDALAAKLAGATP